MKMVMWARSYLMDKMYQSLDFTLSDIMWLSFLKIPLFLQEPSRLILILLMLTQINKLRKVWRKFHCGIKLEKTLTNLQL